ncbi:LemA family protein [Neptunomonas japonica]|uniref:LemA family protein n=1 Tax=Neptunomonas japonica JAMM 1380 TaxID=1441457 RepID=A0A7R6PF31_9GAMM|nr:LemA family protein [Neptunomonas japonica]BBB28972.1 LemA family protein [Neptunomonas japonica JAMM 1380]
MEPSTLTFIVVIAVATFYIISLYNNLVRLKHNVSQAWSNIDILLKQRHDELPKLIDTCREYMQYEQETLNRVIEARSQVSSAQEKQDLKGLGQAESQLRVGLGNLFALAEDYPELKANESFQHLQNRISGIENSIADRREFYNASVNIYNVRIEQFPDVLIAKQMNFTARDLLEFKKADVDIGQLFKSH